MTITLDNKSVKKIGLIDQFRERFTVADNEKLLLPQIIVVGDQSSGKSSILQAISGIKLPRGVDTVTKCPIIIQMRKSTQERKRMKYKNTDYRDIDDTERELLNVQKTVFENQVTKDPIILLVESPNVETLTIIDLPGLVKTEVKGHSKDIIDKTHDIARAYMNQQNSLIICVIPATQEICTTTTINLASECNKDKSRIIVVITKIDKNDEKEAGLLPSIFRNEKLDIKKGYFGLIVGDDILEMAPKDRPIAEEKLFRRLNLWNDHRNILGLQRFTEAMVKELVCLIDKTLPFLETNIEHLMKETEDELSTFSKYHGNTDRQSAYISEAIEKIEKKTSDILGIDDCEIVKYQPIKTYIKEENYLKAIDSFDTFLHFWHVIFTDLYEKFDVIFKTFFKLANAKYKDVKYLEDLLKRSRTESLMIFTSSRVFRKIVGEILDEMKTISLKCVDKCCNVIKVMIETVLVDDIEDKLQMMKTDIKDIGRHVLNQQKQQITDQLEFLFSSEKLFFSQDSIVEAYDKEDKEESSQSLVPQQLLTSQSDQKSGSPLTPSKLANNFVPLQPMASKSMPEIKLPELDKSKYRKGEKLKNDMEKYVTNLIHRLGDIIPNFIRLSLFVNYKSCLKEQLKAKLGSHSKFSSYFNISKAEERQIEMLKERKRSLIASKDQLDRLETNYLNGY